MHDFASTPSCLGGRNAVVTYGLFVKAFLYIYKNNFAEVFSTYELINLLTYNSKYSFER